MQTTDTPVPRNHDHDLALVEDLHATNFTGARYETFIAELYRYAWPVMLGSIRSGTIVRIETGVPHGTIPADDLQVLHDSSHDREELALASIGRAEPIFKHALRTRQWNPSKGRSLRSYFIGACARAFWDEYATWSRHRRKQLRAINGLAHARDTSCYDETAADPGDKHSRQEAVTLLLAKASKISPELEAICQALLRGMSAVEVADHLGYSARAVEGRLYNFRKTAWGLVRSGRIDPALVPGSRARIARELARR